MGLHIVLIEQPVLVKTESEYRALTDAERDVVADSSTAATTEERFAARCDGRPPGYYRGLRRSVAEFSYSGYGAFRELLAEAVFGMPAAEVWADPDTVARTHPTPENALVNLIDFGDSDGFFGPTTSGQIAAGMKAAEAAFAEVANEWDLRAFTAMQEAFQDAADNNGLVVWR